MSMWKHHRSSLRPILRAASAALAIGAFEGAEAQIAPGGGEVQVNTYTTGRQHGPTVAASSQGDFVVAWASYGSYGNDTDQASIQAQRFGADGTPQGAEFQVNTYTTSNQGIASAAMDSQGNFVVVWQSHGSAGTDTDTWSVQAQRFDANGTPLGAQFQVNTITTFLQEDPAVAMSAQGDFVVAWKSVTSSSYEIQARRFSADGMPLGDEFRVNSYTQDYQLTPAVASDAEGNFVVTWMSRASAGSDTDGYSVQAQRFAADGTPAGQQLQVNTYTTGAQWHPAVASDAQGNFIVAWESYGSSGNDTSGQSIQAQRYAAGGEPLGAQFQVNSYTTYHQRYPAVAADAGGDFIVVWQDDPGPGIQAQRFSPLGLPRGGQFQVNTYPWGAKYHGAVASSPNGEIVVAWTSSGSDGSDTDWLSVQARRFGILLRDGFETGDTSRWSITAP